MASMDLEDQLRQLVNIGIALSDEQNLADLLDCILYESRRFTNATAGTLYLSDGEMLHFEVVQNDALDTADSTVRNHLDASGFAPLPINDNSIAGYVAGRGTVLNIRNAYNISEDAPYNLNLSYDQETGFRTQSLLLVPMRHLDGRVLGVIQLINARNQDGETVAFAEDIAELLLALASQAAVAVRNAHLRRDLEQAQLETIMRLGVAAEYRDKETGNHLNRMSRYSREIAKEMGLDEQVCEHIFYASPLHDVGKLGTPDAILLKPGKLTADEYEIMKQHTTIGARILSGSSSPLLRLAERIAISHHEKWNGSGYPAGLKGEEIPLVGRIVAAADVFDALASKRVYKAAFSIEKVLEIMHNDTGSHFDPQVIEALDRCLPRLLDIKARFTEDDGEPL